MNQPAPAPESTPEPAASVPQGVETTSGRWARLQSFRERNAKWEIALFLLAGFIFDALTLSRIDDWLTLVQQGAYLGLLGGLLLLEQRERLGLWKPEGWQAKVWRFGEDAIHFLFGSLLSSYALFYFKSASGWTSLLFLAVLFSLLVANELPRFRALGPTMRVGLLSLCVTSYLAYLLPVLAGMVRPWLFVIAVLLGSGLVVWLFRLAVRWMPSRGMALKQVLAPGLGVQAVLLLLYVLRVTPPVPLSIEQMGIYHDVKKEGTKYLLAHQRPDWKFWQKGDQHYLARSGDKVWAFVRIFAPSRFDDEIVARWYYDDPKRGWVSRGNKRLAVRGVGDRGFRTYSYMTYREVPGDYRVEITTLDGHVIGQLGFTVEADPAPPEAPREFRYDEG